ncbi:MAG: hypothetical protein H7Z10_15795, partial [Gemmatimonadaceae bacterium]|nr:hypothetical protein [Acetobacteraceae bacterium]
MRRGLRIAGWVLGALLLLPVLAVAAVFVGLNTGPGQAFAARTITGVTGGMVVLDGLSGRFPDALRLRHLEVRDADGAWLLADDIVLDWTPTRLLQRTAHVDRLQAARIQVLRLPKSAPSEPAAAEDSAPFSLPGRIIADRIEVARAEIGPGVIGPAAVLSVNGRADVASLQEGQVDLALR